MGMKPGTPSGYMRDKNCNDPKRPHIFDEVWGAALKDCKPRDADAEAHEEGKGA